MTRGQHQLPGARTSATSAFTLLELIIVMTLLAGMFAMVAPRLSDFFSGRSLNEETRRMVALTRYGRSQAIARSERMEFWISPEKRTYGLRPEAENAQDDDAFKPVEYTLARKLEITVGKEDLDDNKEATMTFWPDGTLDEEGLKEWTIVEDETPRTTIKLSANNLEFEVTDATDAR